MNYISSLEWYLLGGSTLNPPKTKKDQTSRPTISHPPHFLRYFLLFLLPSVALTSLSYL